MYASAGLRRGAFTPYAGYAQVRTDTPGADPALLMAFLAQARPGAMGLGTAHPMNSQLVPRTPVQSTLSAGVRWDVRQNIALKAQFDRVLPHEGSNGTLVNLQPGFESGHALQVASVTLDFVF
jgi:hypothetical protein